MTTTLTTRLSRLADHLGELRVRLQDAARCEVAQAVADALSDATRSLIADRSARPHPSGIAWSATTHANTRIVTTLRSGPANNPLRGKKFAQAIVRGSSSTANTFVTRSNGAEHAVASFSSPGPATATRNPRIPRDTAGRAAILRIA